MKLRAILNCDSEFGIGKKNGLLFHLPLDMRFFKEKTTGHVVAMGENTLISFPESKPLKNRINIVLSQNQTHDYENVINVHSMEEFKAEIKRKLHDDDVFIIGGASIYRQMLPYVDEILLTKVMENGNAEVFFPNIDADTSFKLLEETKQFDDNGHKIKFCTYVNLNKAEL